MDNTVVMIGLGQLGRVFAGGLLRTGHVVVPVNRGDDMVEVAGRHPDPVERAAVPDHGPHGVGAVVAIVARLGRVGTAIAHGRGVDRVVPVVIVIGARSVPADVAVLHDRPSSFREG